MTVLYQQLGGWARKLDGASPALKGWAEACIASLPPGAITMGHASRGLTPHGHVKRKYRYLDADFDDKQDNNDEPDDKELSKTSKRLRFTSIKDTEFDESQNDSYGDRTSLHPTDEQISSCTYHASLDAPPADYYHPSPSPLFNYKLNLTLDLATTSSHFVKLQKVLPNGRFEEQHLQNLHYKDLCIWTTPDAFYHFHAALSLHMQATGLTAIDHGVIRDFVLTTSNGRSIITSLLNAKLADNLGLEMDAGCPIVRLAFIISDVFDSHPGLISELERMTDFSRADPALKAWVEVTKSRVESAASLL
ncbi:hypothetical protein BDV97DRAFT_363476 [Delphinella strobiligena]|nr:hypothetical protein BDV97DRAFT_363476 [Delphinella strobiligena]